MMEEKIGLLGVEEHSGIKINRGAEIEFTSMQNGMVKNISYDGTNRIYRTTDGGITWKEEN